MVSAMALLMPAPASLRWTLELTGTLGLTPRVPQTGTVYFGSPSLRRRRLQRLRRMRRSRPASEFGVRTRTRAARGPEAWTATKDRRLAPSVAVTPFAHTRRRRHRPGKPRRRSVRRTAAEHSSCLPRQRAYEHGDHPGRGDERTNADGCETAGLLYITDLDKDEQRSDDR